MRPDQQFWSGQIQHPNRWHVLKSCDGNAAEVRLWHAWQATCRKFWAGCRVRAKPLRREVDAHYHPDRGKPLWAGRAYFQDLTEYR